MRYTMLLATALGIASYFPVWLIQPYMQQTGVPLAWFGPIWAGANLTVALFSLLSHRFHFRLGEKGMAVLFLGLIVTGYLGLGLTGGVWSCLFYYLLTAMRGLQGPLLRTRLQNVSSRENRASILSLKSSSSVCCSVFRPARRSSCRHAGLQPTLPAGGRFRGRTYPLCRLISACASLITFDKLVFSLHGNTEKDRPKPLS
jgi:hypothetical protein